MTDEPRCAACNRLLKRPSPTGLGPVCWRKLHGRPARRPHATSPAPAAPIEGQTELPLEPIQPTLWSI